MTEENVKRTDSISKLYRDSDTNLRSMSNLVRDNLDALATIKDYLSQKKLLKELTQKYVVLEKRVDSLLKNTLPEVVAEEIKYEGAYTTRQFDCTVMFADIVGFTMLAENTEKGLLIDLLHKLFMGFDELVDTFQGTKIKTIGDAYMAVFGAPIPVEDHPVLAVKAGLAFLKLVQKFNESKHQGFQIRIGVHTGNVMAGVVGKNRMQFDVFGDDVNIASRFESSGEPDKINISETTYMHTREFFYFEERGKIGLKNKDEMTAYFVTGDRFE